MTLSDDDDNCWLIEHSRNGVGWVNTLAVYMERFTNRDALSLTAAISYLDYLKGIAPREIHLRLRNRITNEVIPLEALGG